MSNHPKSEAIDYNRLMQANLTRVFNECDAGRRIVAISSTRMAVGLDMQLSTIP